MKGRGGQGGGECRMTSKEASMRSEGELYRWAGKRNSGFMVTGKIKTLG